MQEDSVSGFGEGHLVECILDVAEFCAYPGCDECDAGDGCGGAVNEVGEFFPGEACAVT